MIGTYWLSQLLSRWVAPLPEPAPKPRVSTPPAPSRPSDVAGLLAAVNDFRRANKLPAVRDDPSVRAEAQEWADLMSQDGVLSHGSFADRMTLWGWSDRRAGECLFMGDATPGEVVHAWASDPPHRAIMADPSLTVAGVGVASKSGQTYWCLDLISA